MGSAAVIDSTGNAAGKKAQSYWLAAMKTAAEQNGRDPYTPRRWRMLTSIYPNMERKKEVADIYSRTGKKAGYSEGTVLESGAV